MREYGAESKKEPLSQAAVDAARLYGELERIAIDRVLEIEKVTDNEMRCEWRVIQNPADFKTLYVCRYKVNGTEHTFQTETDYTFGVSNPHKNAEIANQVMKDFCKHLSKNIAWPSFISEFTKNIPVS